MTHDITPSAADSALLFDRTARLRMQFSGPKAAESLNGLITNDVLQLRGGDGLYACALTAKGRIIADVRVLAMAGNASVVDTFMVDTNAAAAAGFSAMIRKYVNPRLAKYADVTESTSCFTLVGEAAFEVLCTAGVELGLLNDLQSGAPFVHRSATIGHTAVRLVRAPDLGAAVAIDIHGARDHAAELSAALLSDGATAAGDAEWHRLRVMAGRPEWGIDMDEGTLAQEANMDALSAISYQKGCYTGQETVARVHFRGHVNRTLRAVRLGGDTAPAVGTSLTGADGAVVGDARSSARAVTGELIGLAMLRREVGAGAAVSWHDDAGLDHEVSVLDAADPG